jgi:hypothetical protein
MTCHQMDEFEGPFVWMKLKSGQNDDWCKCGCMFVLMKKMTINSLIRSMYVCSSLVSVSLIEKRWSLFGTIEPFLSISSHCSVFSYCWSSQTRSFRDSTRGYSSSASSKKSKFLVTLSVYQSTESHNIYQHMIYYWSVCFLVIWNTVFFIRKNEFRNDLKHIEIIQPEGVSFRVRICFIDIFFSSLLFLTHME